MNAGNPLQDYLDDEDAVNFGESRYTLKKYSSGHPDRATNKSVISDTSHQVHNSMNSSDHMMRDSLQNKEISEVLLRHSLIKPEPAPITHLQFFKPREMATKEYIMNPRKSIGGTSVQDLMN
jgi:hypothetical protein